MTALIVGGYVEELLNSQVCAMLSSRIRLGLRCAAHSSECTRRGHLDIQPLLWLLLMKDELSENLFQKAEKHCVSLWAYVKHTDSAEFSGTWKSGITAHLNTRKCLRENLFLRVIPSVSLAVDRYVSLRIDFNFASKAVQVYVSERLLMARKLKSSAEFESAIVKSKFAVVLGDNISRFWRRRKNGEKLIGRHDMIEWNDNSDIIRKKQ